jgi:drug/metabolite transporter (DMT)-like permease
MGDPLIPYFDPLIPYFVLGEVLFSFQTVGGVGVIAAIVLFQIAKEKAGPSTPMEIRQFFHSTERT